MKSTCNQSEKWNAKEAKRMNLSRRFIPNRKSQKPFKEDESPYFWRRIECNIENNRRIRGKSVKRRFKVT